MKTEHKKYSLDASYRTSWWQCFIASATLLFTPREALDEQCLAPRKAVDQNFFTIIPDIYYLVSLPLNLTSRLLFLLLDLSLAKCNEPGGPLNEPFHLVAHGQTEAISHPGSDFKNKNVKTGEQKTAPK